MIVLPPDQYIKIAFEKDRESGTSLWTATLMISPPDKGWPTGCHYFGHLRGVHEEGASCVWAKSEFASKFDDSAIAGVTAGTIDDLFRLTKEMLSRVRQ